jgi:hypothetical protein
MIAPLALAAKDLAVTGLTWALRSLVKVVRKSGDKAAEPEQTEPSQPLSHKDVEWQQAQIRSATAFKVRKP